MDPKDEGRHATVHEWFALDLVDPAHRLAVVVVLGFAGPTAWCAVTLVGAGRRCTTVVEPDAGAPRALELRAPGLWVDLQCLVPFDHVTVDVEAFAVVLDDPADALGEARGERVPFGCELEWDTRGSVTEIAGDASVDGYEVACAVHGIVLVGDERLEIDGYGSRRHLWGAGAFGATPAVRTVTATGVQHRAPTVDDVLATAPIGGVVPLRLDRSLAVVQDPTPTLAWIERSRGC